MAKIVSFGSLNMDLVCQAPRLPTPGETLLGIQFQTVPGGKGANQAVAAARLGATTAMVGRVGDDAFGHSLVASLQRAGVATEAIEVDPTASTGIASIVVDQMGRNHIVVVAGANGQVGAVEGQRLATILSPGDVVLMQFEVPLPAVLAAAAIAQERGATVILDPAPALTEGIEDLYGRVDILTPNQVEASQLVGFPVTDRTTALVAAQVLRQRGVKQVMVKLGADGVAVATTEGEFHQPAIAVPVVDTVAAGDAFNGGLAVALLEGQPLPAAVQFATAVAAYSVTQRGAQNAMPTRAQVNPMITTVNAARWGEPPITPTADRPNRGLP